MELAHEAGHAAVDPDGWGATRAAVGFGAGAPARGGGRRKGLRRRAPETFREEAKVHARSRRKNLAIIKE